MAYKEIYKLPFQSITGNNYSVRIEKDGYTGSSTELVGSRNPFRLETMIGNVFEPMLLSTATLKIFGGDYLQSLFTPNPQGVRVKLLKNNTLEWLGYITNDTYSQDYSSEEFEYEIELVNPISTLKYKKYDGEDGLVNVISLIKEALSLTNAGFSAFYLPTSITNSSNQNIYDLIKISTSNFYDEQDEPMKWYEVLEEIAKYLCLTLTVYKNSVYFIDWRSLKTGHNQYYKYVGNTATIVTLTDTNTIQNLDYSSDYHSLSINSGKNKVKVTCSMYDINEVIPEFSEEGSTPWTLFPMIEYGYKTKKDKQSFKGIIRKYVQPKHTFYHYDKNFNQTESHTPVNIGDLNFIGELGSGFVRMAEFENTDGDPASISFTNLLQVRNAEKTIKLNNMHPILKMSSEKDIIVNKEVWFGINFSVANMLKEWTYRDEMDWKFSSDYTHNVYFSFKVGNKYWNGTNWTTSHSRFPVPIEYKKKDKVLNNYKAVKNQNTYKTGLSLSGYIFQAPTEILSGRVEVVMYAAPLGLIVDSFGTPVEYQYFKDIKIAYEIPTDNIYGDWIEDEDEKNDVVYENEISDDFEEEADGIDLKICTFPEDYTKLCYSTTYINNNLLKTLTYKPLNITDIPEKIIINKVIDYYKNPKYQLTVGVQNKEIFPYTTITDQNSPNKVFCYIGNEINYEFESNNINLIEI